MQRASLFGVCYCTQVSQVCRIWNHLNVGQINLHYVHVPSEPLEYQALFCYWAQSAGYDMNQWVPKPQALTSNTQTGAIIGLSCTEQKNPMECTTWNKSQDGINQEINQNINISCRMEIIWNSLFQKTMTMMTGGYWWRRSGGIWITCWAMRLV